MRRRFDADLELIIAVMSSKRFFSVAAVCDRRRRS
jgi:hypothetical protein